MTPTITGTSVETEWKLPAGNHSVNTDKAGLVTVNP